VKPDRLIKELFNLTRGERLVQSDIVVVSSILLGWMGQKKCAAGLAMAVPFWQPLQTD